MMAVVQESLENLRDLVSVYDNGSDSIVFLIATEIHSLLTSGGVAARLRGQRRFSSVIFEQRSDALSPHHPLIMIQVTSPPPSATYLPQYLLPDEPPRELEFVEWWNREVVFRTGTSFGARVPLEQRETLCRRELIKLLRDKRGAHPDREWPETFDDIQLGMGMAAVASGTDGIQLSSADGTLPIIRQPLGAMVRQIAHEVLVAYGISDEGGIIQRSEPAAA